MAGSGTALIDLKDPFGIEEYIADTTVSVINEDRYSVEQCAAVFERFLSAYLTDRSAPNRNLVENALAESCSKGTSAKRFNNKATVTVGSINFFATLGDFCSYLPADRDNNLRVWCESRPGFADRTYRLIVAKESLRVECSKANNCSFEMAPIGFDYAGALSMLIYRSLGSVERHFITANVGRKTGPSRAHQFETEVAETGVEVNGTPSATGAARLKPLPAPDVGNRTGGLYGR